MKTSVRGTTAAAVTLAAALGLSMAGPHRASAAPEIPGPQSSQNGLAVTILSPTPHMSYSGLRPVEISAFYQGDSGNQIVSLDLYVDGVKAKTETLSAPETRGVVSFLIDASVLTAGPHQFVVRATASDAEVTSAKGGFIYQQPSTDNTPVIQSGASTSAPTLSFTSPSLDGKVQGTVKIKLNASDASGKNPYVSLFIDRQFKTLKNYPPYDFDWDTTTYTNGMHTIEAFGYNDAQNVGHAQTMQVYINNPGGRTERRTDLKDASSASGIKNSKQLYKPLPQTLKAAARRRDTLLASVSVPSRAGIAVTPLVGTNGLLDNSSKMTVTPNLSDPFIKTAHQAKVAVNPSLAPSGAALDIHTEPLTQMADAHLRTELSVKPLLAAPTLTSPAKEVRPVQDMTSMVSKHTVTVRTHTALAAHPRRVHVHVPNAAHTAALLNASGQTSVLFNQGLVHLDRPLAAHAGMLFSPLRQIFEYEGGSLTWKPKTHTVQAQSHTRSFALTIGQKQAVVNHQAQTIAAAPYLNNGRTMVPLSFVSQAMDVKVQYDPSNGHLLITSKK